VLLPKTRAAQRIGRPVRDLSTFELSGYYRKTWPGNLNAYFHPSRHRGEPLLSLLVLHPLQRKTSF
jgi:hypothetical protein